MIDDDASAILCDAQGDIVLEAGAIARRFQLTADEFRRRMAAGLIAGRVETGEGADLGRRRLSIRSGNRKWQAVLDAEGRIESERMTFVRPQAAAQAGERRHEP